MGVVCVAFDVHSLALVGTIPPSSGRTSHTKSLKPFGTIWIRQLKVFVFNTGRTDEHETCVAICTCSILWIVGFAKRVNSCTDSIEPEEEVFRASYADIVLKGCTVRVNK